MSDNMNTTVRVDSISDTSGIDKFLSSFRKLEAAVGKLGTSPVGKALNDDLARTNGLAEKVGTTFTRSENAAMRLLRQRFTFEGRMGRQREREAEAASKAEKLFASEAIGALREKFSFQSRMQRQAAGEARDLAREQMQAARDVARAARESAREQAKAMRDQISQVRELERERGRAMKAAASSVGRAGGAVRRTAVAGSVGAAVVGASARQGFDKLTQAGIGIDEALTQASIHIYGTQKPIDARKSAESLRKKLMPVATKLGSRTADLIGAYVEASQAGVDNDILDKVTEYGSKFAKMNKLSLPKTLEESGYALQGLKAFGNVNNDVVSKYFNHMSYLVATTAANREQMNSFGKRGLAAGASVGMSMDDSLAFGAAATASGAQGSQAARMLSSQGGRIAGWEMHARDISRRRNKTEEDRQFMRAPGLLGFGSFGSMAASFKRDFLGTFATVQESLKKITDPLKRRSLEKQLFGQEFGSLTDAMVMGSNLRDYRQKLNSREADTFIDRNWDKQTGSFQFIVDQIKSVFGNLSDSLGLALKPIWADLRDFAVQMPASFGSVEDAFKAGLSGFLGGLGSSDGTMSGLLKNWLGDPGSFRLSVTAIGDFARGFGRGLRDVVDSVKALFRAFAGGDADPETLGRWAARFLGFSAALVAASPAIGILSALTSAITALGLAASAALRGLGVAGAARGAAVGAGTGAAEAGAGAAGAGILARLGIGGLARRLLGGLGLQIVAEIGAHRGEIATWLGAPQIGSMIWAGFRSFFTEIATDLRKNLSLKSVLGALTPAWMEKGANKPGPTAAPPANGSSSNAQTDAPARIEKQSAASENWKALISPISYDQGELPESVEKLSASVDRLGARIQLAALDSGGVLSAQRIARAAGTGTVGTVMSAAGVPYTPGAGGAALSTSTPGGKLPNLGASGVRGSGAAGGPDNASPEQKSGGSRSWRNNNPGNIEFGAFAKANGATSSDGRFAKFPSYEAGRKAQERLLFDSKGYKDLTLSQAIRRWAPASENNVPAYLSAMKADPNARMSSFSSEQRNRLLDAMQAHEGWKPGTVAGRPAGQLASLGNGIPGAAGSAGGAVDTMTQFLGQNEYTDRGTLSKFVGHDVAGNVNAWCARMVNASLASVGIQGSGSAVANSFQRWGVGIDPKQVAKGDVLLDPHGKGANQTGGHVGMATGRTQIDPRTGKLQIERIAGNEHDSVAKTWVDADKLMVRRAQEVLSGAKDAYQGAKANEAGAGIRGASSDPAALARQSPAERLAQTAPIDPNRNGGGAGRAGPAITPTINIHQAGNPEHTANEVQRRLSDIINYQPQDMVTHV